MVSQIINPIHKTESKHEVSNCRPICEILPIPRLFEKIVLTKLYRFVDKILTSSQHGFHSGISTASNLPLFNNFIMNNINKTLQTDTIYADFLKAFDKVKNHILSYKLKVLGFNFTILC